MQNLKRKKTNSNLLKKTTRHKVITVAEGIVYGIVEGGLWALRLVDPDEQVVNIELVPNGYLVTLAKSDTSFDPPNFLLSSKKH